MFASLSRRSAGDGGRARTSATFRACLRLTAGAALAGTGVAAAFGFSGQVRHAAAAPAISQSVAPMAVANAEPSINQGYWLEGGDGGIFPFGAAGGFGSLGGVPLNQRVVGMASTPDGGGYWMVAADGGVFPFGNAGGFGSTGNIALNQPMVAMASTADGKGYWLVARDGGVFPFGDAIGYGSTGNIHLNQPIVGMAGTPDGRGYWLVASDGGIFPFGDAGGYGSTGGIHLNQSITNMTSTKDGKGYWLCARDGGIFPFGDAVGYGSTGGMHLNRPIVAMAGTPSGQGYWLGATDGGIFPFGDAQGLGSWANHRLNAPIIALVAAPPIGLISLGGGGPITADQGAAGVPIVFELTRAGGSVVANATIVFSLSGLSHGTLSAPSAVTGSDGKVSVIFKDTFPGDTGTVYASVKNTGSKTAAPLITVSQGAPSVLNIAPNQASQVSADGSPVIVTVTDSVGNPFVGATINFATRFTNPSGPPTEIVNPTSAVTNAAGQATTTLMQGHAGDTGVVTVAVVGGPSGQTGPLTVVNGAPTGFVVITQPAASYNADTTAAGSTTPIVAKFQLQDVNHNPVPGVQVTATGPSHLTFPGGNPAVTAADGTVSFTANDTYAGGGQFAAATPPDSGPLSVVAATGQSGATTSFTIAPGAYNHSVVAAAYPGGTVTAGTAAGGITLNTFDSFGNFQTAGAHPWVAGGTTLAAAPSGTLGVLTPTVSGPGAVPATASFTFTPYRAQSNAAGSGLTIDGLSVNSGIIDVVAAAYNHFALATALPASQSAGASGGATLNTFDLYSNPQSASGHVFTTGGTMTDAAPNNASLHGTVTIGAPVATPPSVPLSFTGYRAESASIIVDGALVGSVSITSTTTLAAQAATPPSISGPAAGQVITITLTATDQYGNTAGVNPTVTITDSGTDGGTLSASSVTLANGSGSFTWTAPTPVTGTGSGSIAFSNSFPSVPVSD